MICGLQNKTNFPDDCRKKIEFPKAAGTVLYLWVMLL